MNITIEVTRPGGGIEKHDLDMFLIQSDVTAEEAAKLGSLAIGETIRIGGYERPLLTVKRVA